jgi:hypothetical protein
VVVDVRERLAGFGEIRIPHHAKIDWRDGSEFHFGGHDVTNSSSFTGIDLAGDYTARVETGDRSDWITGVVFAPIGGGLLLTSATLFAAGSSAPGDSGEGVKIASGVFALTGAIMLIGGVVLIAANGTEYTLRRGLTGHAEAD